MSSPNFDKNLTDKIATLIMEREGRKPNRQEILDRALEALANQLENQGKSQPKSEPNDLQKSLLNAYESQKRAAWNGELKRIPTEIKLDFILEFLIDNRASRMSKGLCEKLNLGVGFNEWKKWAEERKEWLDEYNENIADEKCTHMETLEMFQNNPDYQKLMKLIRQ